GLGVPASKILVQNSGVDLVEYEGSQERGPALRREIGVRDDDFLAVYVERLEPAKGHDVLAATRSTLPKGMVIAVFGDGSLHQRLQALDTDRFRVVGPVVHDRVPLILGAADAFVLPSVDMPGTSEGTPTAILEAFAAHVPVVATRAGGIPALIEHERNGLLVEQK